MLLNLTIECPYMRSHTRLWSSVPRYLSVSPGIAAQKNIQTVHITMFLSLARASLLTQAMRRRGGLSLGSLNSPNCHASPIVCSPLEVLSLAARAYASRISGRGHCVVGKAVMDVAKRGSVDRDRGALLVETCLWLSRVSCSIVQLKVLGKLSLDSPSCV